MKTTHIGKYFDKGRLSLPEGDVRFETLPWAPHPVYEGVVLKHLVRGAFSEGRFSYHLVRIMPGMKIGMHVHEGQVETHEVLAGAGVCLNNGVMLNYAPGVISIFAADTAHEIVAGEEGLFLFARFFPALC